MEIGPTSSSWNENKDEFLQPTVIKNTVPWMNLPAFGDADDESAAARFMAWFGLGEFTVEGSDGNGSDNSAESGHLSEHDSDDDVLDGFDD